MTGFPSYSEAVYFGGYHFAHIAAREEELRLLRLQRQAAQLIPRDRRARPR